MSHPLFPREQDDEDDERDISWIHVTRFERTGQVFHPRLFDAKELTSLEDISAHFGGGQYEVIGRTEDRSRVSARHRWSLPGPSIPFVPSDAAGAPAAPPATPAGLSGDHQLLALIMQQSQQSNAQMMQMFMQMNAQTTQVMVAALSRDKGEGSAVVNAIATMAAKDKETLVALLSQIGKQNSGGADQLMKGMELGLEMAAGKAKDDTDSTLETIAGAVQAAAAMANAAGPAPGAPKP